MMENIQAEALLLKLKQELESFKKKKEEVLENLRQEELKIHSIKAMAQTACTHPTEREVNDYNPHKGEDWTDVYCVVCDKYLRRY